MSPARRSRTRCSWPPVPRSSTAPPSDGVAKSECTPRSGRHGGWVAVGDPARILPPDRHDEIWEVQRPLNFPEWVYSFDRSTPDLMRRVTHRLSEALAAHAGDAVIDSRDATACGGFKVMALSLRQRPRGSPPWLLEIPKIR